MIDIDLLRSFTVVYRTRSVTGGARLLGLSQPAMSARLQALEALIGRPLFDRAGRSIVATPAADDLARAIGPYIDGLEAVMAGLRLGDEQAAGTISIGGPPEFLTAFVLPALAQLAGPAERMRIVLDRAAPLLDQVADGALDFAVATVRTAHPGIAYQKLYREQFLLVGAPQWSAVFTSGGIEALEAAPMLTYAEDLPIVRRYWRDVFAREAEMRPALVVPDLRALVAAAEAGAGISVLPQYLCAEGLTSGRLARLHDPVVPPGNDIHLAWNRFALRQPRNRGFRDRIVELATTW